MNRERKQTSGRVIVIEGVGDSTGAGETYKFLVLGKEFGYFDREEMIEHIRSVYSVNGAPHKIIFKSLLEGMAREDFDSLRLGIEWSINRKSQSQLI